LLKIRAMQLISDKLCCRDILLEIGDYYPDPDVKGSSFRSVCSLCDRPSGVCIGVLRFFNSVLRF